MNAEADLRAVFDTVFIVLLYLTYCFHGDFMDLIRPHAVRGAPSREFCWGLAVAPDFAIDQWYKRRADAQAAARDSSMGYAICEFVPRMPAFGIYRGAP